MYACGCVSDGAESTVLRAQAPGPRSSVGTPPALSTDPTRNGLPLWLEFLRKLWNGS